jgi:hypothetical protein
MVLERHTQYFVGPGSKLMEQWISRGAANLLPDSQQAAVHLSVPLFVCRHVASLGHRERHSRVHGACETARSKELAESKATAPLRGAYGTSAGEGVAPCFGGLGAGEAWGPRGLRPETWAPAPTLRPKHRKKSAVAMRFAMRFCWTDFARAPRAAALLAARALRSKP